MNTVHPVMVTDDQFPGFVLDFFVISNGNWTKWNTIRGVLGRFEITSTIIPEL